MMTSSQRQEDRDSFDVVGTAVIAGMVVLVVGTMPRNLLFAANVRYFTSVPWTVPLTVSYLWFLWRYLSGWGPPADTSDLRRRSLRANHLSGRVWALALLAGVSGIAGLVLALRVANRLIVLPEQRLPDLTGVPEWTVLSLLLMAAPVAGIVEEAAFRGYMQGPIERRLGLTSAIVISGTMFAIAHLDFTLILWPYYVAVAALYGTITHLTNSILPAVVLHTGGNVYSNLDLWRHGQAEWQAPAHSRDLIWGTGADASFWILTGAGLAAIMVTSVACVVLARAVRNQPQ